MPRQQQLRRSTASSSSSTGFEENIPLMVSSGIHGHLEADSPSLATSLRRALVRCTSRVRHRHAGRVKLALLFIGLVAALVALAPLGLMGVGPQNGSNTSNLHARNGTLNESQNEFLRAMYDVPLPATPGELEELNELLEDVDPRIVLKWAHRRLIRDLQEHDAAVHPLVQSTSFGPTGLVVLHLLSQLHMLGDVPVVTMDTLHLFPESVAFYNTIQSYYKSEGIKLVVTKPLRMNEEGAIARTFDSRTEFEATYGSTLWKTDPQQFAAVTKVDPLNRALDELQAQMWITGRRRSSGGERADMPVVEFEYFSNDDGRGDETFDAARGRYKLNPLAYWTYAQVWEYIRSNGLPYNELYDKGYTSLGDVMTTRLPLRNATAAGEGAIDAFERSGRFVGLGNRTECGLHSHLKRVNEMKKQAAETGEELAAPKLQCDKCIDLTADNFEERVTAGDAAKQMLFIEFYSPYCGSCQEFAPTLDRLATLASETMPDLEVVRFDITESDVPKVEGTELFKVEITPTLYRVRYAPELRVELYEGEHEFDAILQWLEKSS
ncbi:hypothetical protein ACHAXT_005942 [Thalassiosira profunda]